MYLIHPIWFYVYGLLSSLCGLLIALIIFSVILSIIYFFTSTDYKGEMQVKYFKICKRYACIAITLAVLLTIIPSEKTMLQMAVASYATSENVEKLTKNGKLLKDELKNDFLEIIQSIKEDKEEIKSEEKK